MLIKAHVVSIVTLMLAKNTVVQSHRFSKWNIVSDFLCSYIWTKGDGTFETTRIPEMRSLVGSSSVDVGTCPIGLCSNIEYIHNFDCGNYGYICPLTETGVADLGLLGTHEYEYVTKCGCCKDEGIKVTVQTVDSKTGEPLGDMTVLVNNDVIGYTDENGYIELTVEPTVPSLVFRSEDGENGNKLYIHAVIVIDLQLNSRVPIDVKLNMIKKAEPVTIDQRTEQTLSLSDDPLNPNAGNAFIVIAPNSFRGKRWWDRPREIKASVTFIDTNTGPEEQTPGRFLTRVGDTYQNLISDGIVAFEFTDVKGNVLRPKKPIEFNIPLDMQLWKLDVTTGTWLEYGVLSESRKRQVTLTQKYLADIVDTEWINIDQIRDAPNCYFKARIFKATNGDEITSSLTATFKPGIIGYTNDNLRRLRLYPSPMSSPSDTCFVVPCPDVSNPNDSLTGFINMSSIELVSIGGVSVSYKTFLTPRNLVGYIPQIQTRHGAVQYTVAPNGLDVFVNFVSHGNGPFYPNLNACENSPVNQPAFHFFKPDLPSYVAGPSDADVCIARIAFKKEGNSFYDYTSNTATNLPNITGISTWTTDNGESQYFTDTVQLQESIWNASDYFVYACLRYRCSGADQPTTVYLDIHIPNDTYYFNTTDENGNIVERNRTVPAFSCHGQCQGNVCHQNINGTTIDGTFIAPEDAESGPDFYDSQNIDCDDRTSSEAFALEFYCYVNRRGKSDDQAVKRRIIEK